MTGIILDHPFRLAKEEKAALDHIFTPVRAAMKKYGCQRAILVGHNAHFDLGFVNAAVARTGHKRNPFHPFSVFDTVTLAGIAYGQTVLARAATAAGLGWDANEAHSAVYDTEQTARLFCTIANAGRGKAANGATASTQCGPTVRTHHSPHGRSTPRTDAINQYSYDRGHRSWRGTVRGLRAGTAAPGCGRRHPAPPGPR